MIRQMMIVVLCVFSLIVGSASARIWKDDFERDELGEGWATFKRFNNDPEPDWKIEDGVVKGHWPFWGVQLVIKEYPSLDYTIQVDCRIDKIWMEPAFANVAFRVSKPDLCPSFYGFGISSSQGGFTGDPGCDVNSVKAVPRRHKVGQWYTLKLVAKGGKFVGYVNDAEACDLTDKRYKGKFVGLITGCNTDASFDNFMITDRVDDNAFAEFSVSPELTLTGAWGAIKAK